MKGSTGALLAVGGLAVGAVLGWLLKPAAAAPSPSPSPAPSPTQAPTSGLNLVPGVSTTNVAPGLALSLVLPQGATWNSLVVRAAGTTGTAVPVSGTGPATITTPNAVSATVAAMWTDAAGKMTTSVLVLLPPGSQPTDVITDGPTLTAADQSIARMLQMGELPGITGASTRAQALTVFQQNSGKLTQGLYTLPVTGNLDYLTAAAIMYF